MLVRIDDVVMVENTEINRPIIWFSSRHLYMYMGLWSPCWVPILYCLSLPHAENSRQLFSIGKSGRLATLVSHWWSGSWLQMMLVVSSSYRWLKTTHKVFRATDAIVCFCVNFFVGFRSNQGWLCLAFKIWENWLAWAIQVRAHSRWTLCNLEQSLSFTHCNPCRVNNHCSIPPLLWPLCCIATTYGNRMMAHNKD